MPGVPVFGRAADMFGEHLPDLVAVILGVLGEVLDLALRTLPIG